MTIKIERLLKEQNNVIPKQGKDFGAYLDKALRYHIYPYVTGCLYEIKLNKGEEIILDLCIFEDKKTLIKGKVIRVYKNQFIIEFEYVD